MCSHPGTVEEAVMPRMNRAQIDGIEFAYELRGVGEPVVLIHWGVASAWAEPPLREPGLAESYRLVSYHRAGFGESSRVTGPISMADHARHCSLLLRRLENRPGAHRRPFFERRDRTAACRLDFPEAVGTMVLLWMRRARSLGRKCSRRSYERSSLPPSRSIAPATGSPRSTPSCAESSKRITGNRSRRGYRAPSTGAWKRRMRSSRRSSRPFRHGRSPGRTPLVLRNYRALR